MRLEHQQILLSATDLAKHLACRHLMGLDLRNARGQLKRPFFNDPAATVLAERGFRHEAGCLAHLNDRGHKVLQDDATLQSENRFERTIDAMRSGVDVIAQADLKDGRWRSRVAKPTSCSRPGLSPITCSLTTMVGRSEIFVRPGGMPAKLPISPKKSTRAKGTRKVNRS